MGLLSAGQIAAISAGAPVRHVFTLIVPENAAHSAYEETVIHDCANGPRRLVDPGRRRCSAFNFSLAEPGKFETYDYAPAFNNSDFAFDYRSGRDANLFKHSSTAYESVPLECFLRHQFYVMVAAAWSELTMVAYEGRIVDVEYDGRVRVWQAGEGASDAQEYAHKTATLLCRLRSIHDIMTRVWTESDGDSIDTGINVSGGA